MIIKNISNIENLNKHKAKLTQKEEAANQLVQNKLELNNKMKKSHTNPQFTSAVSKAPWFYRSKVVKWVLDRAADKQLIFDAGFALILTCLLRPASIVLLPSKKNKDDQKYAAAHSIASGIIGFIISNIVFLPISNAIIKMKNAPEKYISKKSMLGMDNGKPVMNKIAKTYIDRLPDVLGSVPKGILTIALIPPILEHAFGVKKRSKTKNADDALLYTDYSLLNFKQNNNNNVYQNFMGGRR